MTTHRSNIVTWFVPAGNGYGLWHAKVGDIEVKGTNYDVVVGTLLDILETQNKITVQ